MKKYEHIMKALECCADAKEEHCNECYYKGNCPQKDKDALALIEEMEAKLEALEQPTAMMDYKAEYLNLQRDKTRLLTELDVMRDELNYLRAVKATAEAFLGREIK